MFGYLALPSKDRDMTGGSRYFPVAIPSFIDNIDHTLPLHSNNCAYLLLREKKKKNIMNAYLLQWGNYTTNRQLMPSVDDAYTELETAK